MNWTNASTGNDTEYPCMVPPVLFGIPNYVNIIQGVMILAVALVSLALNGFVILLILKFKTLHQRAFYLALQICISNFIFTIIIHLSSFVTTFLGGPLLGTGGCQAVGFIHDALVSARYISALVLGLDRMFTIFFPFWYSRNGGKVSAAMCVVLWIWCVFRGTAPLQGLLDCFVYIPTFKTCSIALSCSPQCQQFGIFAFVFIYVAGTFIPLFIYIILFRKARQLQKKIVVPVLAPNITNGKEIRHNRRAIFTFLILFIALLGCSLPPFVIFLAFQIELALVGRPSMATTIIQLLIGRIMFLLLPAVDPIVILRNRDVRDTLNRFLKKKKDRLLATRSSTDSASSSTSTTAMKHTH